MRQTRNRLCGALATLLLWGGQAHPAAVGAQIPAPRDVPYPGVIQLHVDATDVDRRVLRVKETFPVAAPGRTTLLVRSADTFRTVSLDYHGGLRYPHLERIEQAPDLLSSILQSRLPVPAARK